jgi:hypothetical protein
MTILIYLIFKKMVDKMNSYLKSLLKYSFHILTTIFGHLPHQSLGSLMISKLF